jgi:nitric oxide reductase subunit B
MGSQTDFLQFLMNPKKWWIPFTIIFSVSISGVAFIGYETYNDAPPLPSFLTKTKEFIFTKDDILKGQSVFQRYALMDYGSMFGDGANRGPDFTAQALHQTSVYMREFYQRQSGSTELEQLGINEKVKIELKENRYEEETNSVILSDAQHYALLCLQEFYIDFFSGKNASSFQPAGYFKSEDEIKNLTTFFFWGGWVCSTERPGETYSYTHNWPFDPQAGNNPESPVVVWTVIGSLGLIIGLGIVLYYHGRLDKLDDNTFLDNASPLMTNKGVDKFTPTTSQRATYKYFYAAILLFLVQVLAGVLTVHDFVGFTVFFGYDLREILPITITRGWHVQLSLLWISACWIGASFFVVPFLSAKEPKNQKRFIDFIFLLIIVLVVGSVVGIYAGPMGIFENWYWFGNQGWEYLEPGKLWQSILFLVFALWCIALYRALRPVISLRQPWALPNWLVYATFSILILLLSGFIATPKTNFVIADFWRWCVIHMWAEAFFEVFTTVLVGYFMVLMGLVCKESAIRVIYLAALLFLGSGLLGISHNFYWSGKPVATMALGSVFSTLQVVPLILLTLEAWRFRKLPQLASASVNKNGNGQASMFGMMDIFLFLVGVNFWNFFGAGVLGFIINLPLANYYEHGTYLTVNHGHAALMGVYGNLSIAAVLFCCKLLTEPAHWNSKLVKISFLSINSGLILMVLLDLFPAGILQFNAVASKGLWFARSAEFIEHDTFQTLTWLRIIGGSVFLVGGVLPLVKIVYNAGQHLKATHKTNLKAVKTEEKILV